MAKIQGSNREVRPAKCSEADIQRTVVEFLQLDGWRAIRTDPVSDRSRGKGFGEIGMPDYLFIRYGEVYQAEVLWIEFKARGKTPTAKQIDWHEKERRAGGVVIWEDDIDDFRVWYKDCGLQRRV